MRVSGPGLVATPPGRPALQLSAERRDLENAQAMAAHEPPRTTKLYDRRRDTVTLDEVEKITI
jgi:hypothetical protein